MSDLVSVTYSSGLQPGKKKYEKFMTKVVRDWIQLAGLIGDFRWAYCTTMSWSVFKAYSKYDHVCVDIPEAGKKGNLQCNSQLRGGICKIWSVSGTPDKNEIQTRLETVTDDITRLYTKQPKNKKSKLKKSISDIPSNEVLCLEELPPSVTDFSTNLSAMQILILLYLSQDKEIASRLFCDYAEEEFKQQVYAIGLSKSELSNTSTLDDLEMDEEVYQQVCENILSQYRKEGEENSQLSIIQEVLLGTLETLKDKNQENASTLARCAKEVEGLRERHTAISLQRNQIFKALGDKQNEYTVLESKRGEVTKSITFFEHLKVGVEKQQEEVSLVSDLSLIKELAAEKGMDLPTYLAQISEMV